jgi:hypothetical protein
MSKLMLVLQGCLADAYCATKLDSGRAWAFDLTTYGTGGASKRSHWQDGRPFWTSDAMSGIGTGNNRVKGCKVVRVATGGNHPGCVRLHICRHVSPWERASALSALG